jgi:hypothetical protein
LAYMNGRDWAGENLLKRAIARVTVPQLWNHFALPGRVKVPAASVPLSEEDPHPSFYIFANSARWKDHGNCKHGGGCETIGPWEPPHYPRREKKTASHRSPEG